MTAPFGIELHSAVDQIEILEDLGQGKYRISPPKMHPNFETYVVQATPKVGVFWVKAVSPLIENDAFGVIARRGKDQLGGQLAQRYGVGRSVDQLFPGSIWDEPRYWTQSLSANERECYVLWERTRAHLPDDLETIFLGINGFGTDQTNYFIEYASTKMRLAEAEIQEMLSDLL